MSGDFHGLRAVVTGAGSGIGLEVATQLAQAGAEVIGLDLHQGDLEGVGHFVQCDISDVEALKAAIGQVEEALGTISVLVNNAANDARHTLSDYSVDEWDQGMAVNLRPHFFTAQAVADGMRAAGGGSIINYSSISYMMGNAGYPAYATSKAAITGLTRSLARELGPDNIRVNALMPGWVLTDKQLEMWATPEDLAAHLQRQCLKEHLKPQDVVDATLFLASQTSRMITGQALVVDGGVVVTG